MRAPLMGKGGALPGAAPLVIPWAISPATVRIISVNFIEPSVAALWLSADEFGSSAVSHDRLDHSTLCDCNCCPWMEAVVIRFACFTASGARTVHTSGRHEFR
jgi:hypothetical protein